MASIKLENINKIFKNGFQALFDINLEIRDKEFFVIVGPSGCGKTTILRSIAGLESITSGNIFIDGILSNRLHPKDRDIAMVFQDYALYPHMTAWGNIAFDLQMRKKSKNEIKRKIEEVSEILHIEDILNKKPPTLSGGEKQRVALGRAIARDPRVFLFDEPLSNLDAKLRQKTRAELLRLHSNLKTTMIYVTHDQIEAMTMGERIVVMNKGVIQQIDTPKNIYNKPKNKFVAEFIGSPPMNFIEIELNNKNDCVIAQTDGILIPLNDEQIRILTASLNNRFYVGFRPEDLSINFNGHDNTMKARVDVLEQLGSGTILHLQYHSNELVAFIRPDYSLANGDYVSFDINSEKCHYFDLNNGECLV